MSGKHDKRVSAKPDLSFKGTIVLRLKALAHERDARLGANLWLELPTWRWAKRLDRVQVGAYKRRGFASANAGRKSRFLPCLQQASCGRQAAGMRADGEPPGP